MEQEEQQVNKSQLEKLRLVNIMQDAARQLKQTRSENAALRERLGIYEDMMSLFKGGPRMQHHDEQQCLSEVLQVQSEMVFKEYIQEEHRRKNAARRQIRNGKEEAAH